MKKSDELNKKASMQDNDLKYLGLKTKAIREKNIENFIEKWFNEIREKYNIYEVSEGKFTIETEKHGFIDYFPKANKLFIRNKNKWIKPGLKWIVNNLIIN